MTEEQKRKRDESAEAKATELWFHPNQPTEIDWAVRSALLRAFKAGADWGFPLGVEQGRAETDKRAHSPHEFWKLLQEVLESVDALKAERARWRGDR